MTTADKPVDILLIGLGSIGSIYAYLLEKSGKARVTAVARSNYSLYTTSGVTLETERFGKIENWKPYRVVKSQAEALEGDFHYDFCLVTTKSLPDVLPTPEMLKECIASGKVGAWSLVQNGLNIEEDLYKATKHLGTPIISTCAWVLIQTSPDGETVYWRGLDKNVSGLYSPSSQPGKDHHRTFTSKEDAALTQWKDLFESGGGHISLSDRQDSVRYQKNIWNCVWSSIQGLVRTTPACFLPLSDELTQPIRNLIHEVVTVGFTSGLLWEGMANHPQGGVVGNQQEVEDIAWTFIMASAKHASGGHRMSLLIDIDMGRPIEVEVIVGSVLKVAREYNVATPLLDFAYLLLKGVQVELLKQQKSR
ncbi:hypothetical protein P7C73_g3854, partial [Tremellales sp. Uapishka_1]